MLYSCPIKVIFFGQVVLKRVDSAYVTTEKTSLVSSALWSLSDIQSPVHTRTFFGMLSAVPRFEESSTKLFAAIIVTPRDHSDARFY